MNLARAFRKVVIDPFRYGFIGYDAERYWHDRYEKYRFALCGSGNEALGEYENEAQYRKDTLRLGVLAGEAGVDWLTARVLDIGCGNGQYVKFCHQYGVKNYVGLDITDTLMPYLKRVYPDYAFVVGDCTGGDLAWSGFRADVVLMIDVIEHIVSRKKLTQAMDNARAALAPGGVFIVGPVLADSRKRLFYLHNWTAEDIMPGFEVKNRMPFKDGTLLALVAK